MGLRQPVQLFDAAAQTHAKNFAPTNGDQGMCELVALGQCVGFTPGIKVGKNPLPAPFAGRNDQHEGDQQDRCDQKEHAGIDAAQKQDTHGNHGNHHEGTHVRLGQQQHTNHRHSGTHGQHGAEKALLHIHLAHHVVSGVKQHGELGQLRRLEAQRPQTDPAPGTVHHLSHMGDQHQRQQHQRHHKQGPRVFFPSCHRHLVGQQGRGDGDHQPHGMAKQEIGRGVFGKTRVLGQRNGGRIDHHQPPQKQRHRNPHQRLVKALRAGGYRASGRQAGGTQAYRQHIADWRTDTAKPAEQA